MSKEPDSLKRHMKQEMMDEFQKKLLQSIALMESLGFTPKEIRRLIAEVTERYLK